LAQIPFAQIVGALGALLCVGFVIWRCYYVRITGVPLLPSLEDIECCACWERNAARWDQIISEHFVAKKSVVLEGAHINATESQAKLIPPVYKKYEPDSIWFRTSVKIAATNHAQDNFVETGEEEAEGAEDVSIGSNSVSNEAKAEKER
jgi:hypothetical protein